ncbi:MAG: hypothetical protein RL038_171, partial [Actinomycetota bacterium]
MKKLAALVVAFLLASCAGIPNAGEVQVVPDLQLDFDAATTRAIVRPPVAGMNQLEIVQGFVNSHADPTANYEISRLYLSNAINRFWRANKVEVIDSSSAVFELVESNIISMTYDRIGVLNNSGELEFLEEPLSQVALFETKRQGGEIRILQAPTNAYMSIADLNRSYSPQQLYFFNSDYSRLVPVSRWLPGSDVGLATRLVNELLDGPTAGLEVSLRSAIPA